MADGERDIEFTLGVTKEGKVLVDFGDKKIDHLMLNDVEALEMAEGLVEAVRQAGFGRADILRIR